VTDTDPALARVIRGTFHRAVDPAYRNQALAGSRSAGRYSRPHEPTLYLSSSVDGVHAAMIAHKQARSTALEIVQLDVRAPAFLDLRDPTVLEGSRHRPR
jgi:RES domain-containing protein